MVVLQVIWAPDLERDLLYHFGALGYISPSGQHKFVVLILRIGAQKHDTAVEIFIGDLQAHNARVEITHFHQVFSVDANMSQPLDPWHIKCPPSPCRAYAAGVDP